MSDGFNTAPTGPQPDHTAPESMRVTGGGSQFGSLPPPPPSPQDMHTAMGHMLAAVDQLMALWNHAAAVTPSLGGMGMIAARVQASLLAARAAMTPQS